MTSEESGDAMASPSGRYDSSLAPLVSVVMPAFNAQRYIRDAIHGLQSQTLSNFEAIIVDDGSSDRTSSIVEEFIRKDPRIILVRRANTGISGARNDGLRLARADFLASMDADDISMPNRLQLQFDFMQTHPEVVALGGAVQYIDPFGAAVFMEVPLMGHTQIDTSMLNGNGSAIRQPAVMLRTASVRAVGGYSLAYSGTEDLDLFLRLAEVGRVENLPELLVQYRQHPQSTNALQWQEQSLHRQQCVSDALRRRYGPDHPPAPLPGYQMPSASESYLRWGWCAVKSGNRFLALRHAALSFWVGGRLRDSAILAGCAIRGY